MSKGRITVKGDSFLEAAMDLCYKFNIEFIGIELYEFDFQESIESAVKDVYCFAKSETPSRKEALSFVRGNITLTVSKKVRL